MKIPFPDPRTADHQGLLWVGGSLSVENLVSAYSRGIFPWPQLGLPMLWFSPAERGVLDFADLHVSRSLKKLQRNHSYRLTFNQAFAEVIEQCARAPRPDQDGTWILPAMVRAYTELHRAGYAHSVECWEGDQLVGGMYGVRVGNAMSGESMFFLHDNTSKLCLLHLIERLREIGHTWIDTQMVTPVLEAFGAKYISRDEFLRRLEHAHRGEEKPL